MKKLLGVFVVLVVMCSICFAVEFSDFDLKNQWLSEGYEDIMNFLVQKGVINGYPDGTFKPSGTITRAEMSKVLVVAFDIELKNEEAKITFPDVKENAWYAKYVYALVNEGAIKGYEDGTFKPDNEVTLGEIVLMLDRLAGYSEGKTFTNQYSKEVNIWDCAEVGGLFKGYLTDDMVSIKPETRENVVVLVYNAMMFKANAEKEPTVVSGEVKEPVKEAEKEPTKPVEEPKTDPNKLTANKTYFGVVGSQSEEAGEKYIDVNTFENGVVKLKVVKIDKKPLEKSLIIFTVKSTGNVKLEKELKVADVEEGYLLVEEVDDEVVVFANEAEFLDTTEDYYMYGQTKVKLFNQEYYLVTADEDDVEGIEFKDCEKLENNKLSFKKDDRVFFDTNKDICIIVRGLEKPEGIDHGE